MKKTRTKKNIPAVSKFPESIHSKAVRKLCGLDDAALRRLAGKGIIPPAKLSLWPTIPTLQGLFAHLGAQRSALPVFDSLEACGAFFSKSFLQTLKAAGLPGFENTRVDFNKLLPAIEPFLSGTDEPSLRALKGEGVATWKEMREKYQALLSKLEHAEASGSKIDKAVAIDAVRELQTIHYHSRNRMIDEWPNMLAGQGAGYIRGHIIKANEAINQAEENAIAALEKAKKKNVTQKS